MICVDTSALLEWWMNSPTASRLAPHWPAQERMLLPTIVQFETAKWAYRKLSEEDADRCVAFTTRCFVTPLTQTVALRAAEFSLVHKLATADAIVYATAQMESASLLTCDAHFSGLPGVTYVAKD